MNSLKKTTQIRQDADRDLVQVMTTITRQAKDMKEVQEGTRPVIGLFYSEGDKNRPLADVLKELPGRISSYIKEMGKSCIR